MRKATTTLFVIFLAAIAGAQEASAVSGAWAVTITTDDGKISGEASLTQSGDKVSGRLGPPRRFPLKACSQRIS